MAQRLIAVTRTKPRLGPAGNPVPGEPGITQDTRHTTPTERQGTSMNRSTGPVDRTADRAVHSASSHRRAVRRPVPVLTAMVTAVVISDLGVKGAVAAVRAANSGTGALAPMRNPDFSLGLVSAPWRVLVAVMVLGVVVAATTAVRLAHRIPPAVSGLVVGGAIANTIDRAIHGAVQDYLIVGDVVVNLADLAVLIGMVLAGVFVLLRRARHRPAPTERLNPGRR